MTPSIPDLDRALNQTFEDFSLSRGERHALRALLDDIDGNEDTFRHVRNHAFKLAESKLRSETDRQVINWLEDVLKQLDGARETHHSALAEARFSPGHDCLNQILYLIRSASTSIDACVFTITDNRITTALLDAHKRGVRIRVLTDDDKALDRGSDIRILADHGIPVHTDDSPNHMHHKFALFDRNTLLNGSFNWTRSATDCNQENLIVTDDPRLVTPFTTEFNRLWATLPELR